MDISGIIWLVIEIAIVLWVIDWLFGSLIVSRGGLPAQPNTYFWRSDPARIVVVLIVIAIVLHLIGHVF